LIIQVNEAITYNLEIKNKAYFENDVCELKISLVDSGEDRIIVKVLGFFIF